MLEFDVTRFGVGRVGKVVRLELEFANIGMVDEYMLQMLKSIEKEKFHSEARD